MKKFVCLVFAKHPGNRKNYLFRLDYPVRLKAGQRISVETSRGVTEAEAVGESFLVEDCGVVSIAENCGAYFPLKRVLGTIEEVKSDKLTMFPLMDEQNELPF